MRIIGIDVAPARGGHIYEGGANVVVKSPQCLAKFLESVEEDAVIAWDAPLTACASTVGPLIESDLTQRVIEAFFVTGVYKVPKGISVSGYSGCQHWTISRRLLGLPRVGRYDIAAELPFALISDQNSIPKSGRSVVEVHAAVALWLWFKDRRPNSTWQYKKNPEIRKEIWNLLKNKFASLLPGDLRFSVSEIPNDDELDAITAWILAYCWLNDKEVSVLGDATSGAFLLPSIEPLQNSFGRFSSRNLEARRRVDQGCA